MQVMHSVPFVLKSSLTVFLVIIIFISNKEVIQLDSMFHEGLYK